MPKGGLLRMENRKIPISLIIDDPAPVISIVLEKISSTEPQPTPTPDDPAPTPEDSPTDSSETNPPPAPSTDSQSAQKDSLALSPIAILALIGGGGSCIALGAIFASIIRKRKN